MSLKSVYNKIEKLASISSNNERGELLKKYLKNGLFRRIVWLSYNDAKYKAKKFPEYKNYPSKLIDPKSVDRIFEILKDFANATGVSLEEKKELFYHSSIDPETYELVRRICNKDLNCGVDVKSINKARPGTIKYWPYQRCRTSKNIDNIKFDPDAIAQIKADGSFAQLFIHSTKKMYFRSRSGKLIKLPTLISNIRDQDSKIKYGSRRGVLSNRNLIDNVYMGELRVWEKDMKTPMSRKKGNGIINSIRQETCTDPELEKRVFFTVWECVPIEDYNKHICDISYRTRFYNATLLTNAIDNKRYVQTIKSKFIRSIEEAYAFYRQARIDGEEGAIIKNLHAIWKDDQSGSPDMIKLKHSFECDLICKGWKYGTVGGKWENGVGSVLFESSCGKLKVAVSGLSDEEREWDWDMMYDEIAAVEAESVITSKSKDVCSLYTPSFIEIRTDKTEADSLERILEIEKESKKLKRRKS